MRRFEIVDLKTGVVLFTGKGIYAQDVYDDWRRRNGHKVTNPKDCESDDPKLRAEAFAKLHGTDTWIEDSTIYMRLIEERKWSR